MEKKLTTIDPNQGNIPDAAIIQKVVSENDRLPNGEHEKAVKAFYFSDSIASGIGKDFAFVEKIPQLISDIINNKSWECLYVSRGVVTPYYCRYTKGSNSENFRAFITAKRPNGLGTSIETIDRLLEAETEVQWKFRTIVYESRQGERNDLSTSGGDCPKSDLSERQQKTVRAANRAAEAIPEIRELLDRGLIAIDVAAKLGRDIKDPDNLTAEEREYIDKRDLVGLRIKAYINTNTIPEDEDKEPAYSRKLNEFVKDLLGIKNRSKTVRMDNPKKAAEKLLKFYEGQRLKELVEYLNQGLKEKSNSSLTLGKDGRNNLSAENRKEQNYIADEQDKTSSKVLLDSKSFKLVVDKEKEQLPTSGKTNSGKVEDATPLPYSGVRAIRAEKQEETHSEEMRGNQGTPNSAQINDKASTPRLDMPTVSQHPSRSSTLSFEGDKDMGNETIVNSFSKNIQDLELTSKELAQRLGVKPDTISDVFYKRKEKFTQWSRNKDPENIGWTRTEEKKGRSFLFVPVQKN